MSLWTYSIKFNWELARNADLGWRSAPLKWNHYLTASPRGSQACGGLAVLTQAAILFIHHVSNGAPGLPPEHCVLCVEFQSWLFLSSRRRFYSSPHVLRSSHLQTSDLLYWNYVIMPQPPANAGGRIAAPHNAPLGASLLEPVSLCFICHWNLQLHAIT